MRVRGPGAGGAQPMTTREFKVTIDQAVAGAPTRAELTR